VQYNSTGEIERVTEIDGDGKYINRVDVKDCNKLPIKFKPFEIHETKYGEYFITETRLISKGETVIRASALNGGIDDPCNNACFFVNAKHTLISGLPTIEEARDWLELQYATILAKTKNII